MGCCTLLHLTEDNARFLLLAIVLVIYMLAGAALFQYLEGEAEVKMAHEFWRIYSDFRRHYLLLILQAGNNTGGHGNGSNCSETNEDNSQQNSSHVNELDMEKVHQLFVRLWERYFCWDYTQEEEVGLRRQLPLCGDYRIYNR
ncbi:hypothetical protein L9F63_018351 [Diploptera punctata]|uniref:Uncharacterized protein n=1 Tax=Diploptera punctata TaxID=6984 RepID=A0AAD7ZYS8_DIPPU|nr:hypothetical protein L9F63_018351 [Diploptera punctata]